jgi:hypothetical protein
MKRLFSLLAVCFTASATLSAAVPPPEQLLPADTLVVVTLPDAEKARATWSATPVVQFWNSAEMKPFRDKFTGKLASDVLTPIEKELGITFSNYTALARGQFTFALTLRDGAKAEDEPNVLLLIDTKDKAPEAEKLLTELKRKWADSGKALKHTKVRDVEFTTVSIDGKAIGKALEKTFPSPPGSAKPPGEEADQKSELSIGQSGPLLMIGNNPAGFEKVLVRLSGGTLPALGEQASFQSAYNAHYREAVGYVWFNARTVFDLVQKSMQEERGAPEADNPLAPPSPAKIFQALGLTGLQSVGFYLQPHPDGQLAGLFAGVPEASRRGLFKILAPEAKDAGPASFVPADATRYFRWRLDGQKTWANLEALIVELFPPAQGVLGMIMENAGKDQDPNFDLRKMLIGNLGDDLITFEKAPRSVKIEDLMSPPSLTLVGSPRAEQLASSIRTGMGFMIPPGAGGAQEREFLGRKIHSLPAPSMPGQISLEQKTLSYAASGSYVVFSQDTPLLEEYLRGPESQGRPLRELPGLNEAAQKVGGFNTGMFGFDNQTESVKLIYEALRREPAAFEKLLSGPMGVPPISAEMRQNRQAWFDFSLLPPWDAAAKYFHWSVYAGSSTAEALHFKAFSPNPPGLR